MDLSKITKNREKSLYWDDLFAKLNQKFYDLGCYQNTDLYTYRYNRANKGYYDSKHSVYILIYKNVFNYKFIDIVYDLIKYNKFKFIYDIINEVSDSDLIIAANIILNEGNNSIKI